LPLEILVRSGASPNNAQARALVRKAVNDYEFALAKRQSYWANWGVHARAALLFGLGQGWRQLGNQEKAREYLSRIEKECARSPYEREASAPGAESAPEPAARLHRLHAAGESHRSIFIGSWPAESRAASIPFENSGEEAVRIVHGR
jgi:hypothetical protein